MSLTLIAGCTTARPDFAALYDFEVDTTNPGLMAEIQPPVVVIPGIVSSTLVDENGDEVWFGPWHQSLFGSYEDIGLDIDPATLNPLPSTIKAGRLPETIMGFDFYGSLFEVLQDYGHYKPTELGTPFTVNERRYYKFAYDWRYDTVDTVAKLDAFIEQIREDYNDPNLEVDLVAHSMGGLVARYYMRYGTADVLDDNDFPVTQAGAAKVRRLIQLGAPNLGSVVAVHQMLDGYKVVFGTVPVEVMVTMPSVYQLMPHPLTVWLIDVNGDKVKQDLFDASNWQRLEWGIYNPEVVERIYSQYPTEAEGAARVELLQDYFGKHIERARRFVWSLTVPVPDVSYSIVAFGGNCSATPARIVFEETDGLPMARLSPDDIENPVKGVNYDRLMLEPGDGRVTKPSVLARDFLDPSIARHEYSFIPLDQAFFLCHNHGQLTGNVNFQDNLLNALLERDPPLMDPDDMTDEIMIEE
jgi:pimeloyl-ACP methyl ester carboxylesterase